VDRQSKVCVSALIQMNRQMSKYFGQKEGWQLDQQLKTSCENKFEFIVMD